MRWTLGLLLTLASPAFAQLGDYDYEKLDVLGWGDGCSVAVAHYAYAITGRETVEEPAMGRIGTLSIPPGQAKQKEGWLLTLHGTTNWRPKEAERALAQLAAKGYSRPGWVEEVGANPVVAQRDLPRLLNTLDALKPVLGRELPGKGWRWTKIIYQPVSNCALLVFERGVRGRPFYDFLLAHIDNPAARSDRSLAHLTNALLLLDKGDLPGALAESELAARLDPDDASNRYHHAALMALSGIVEPTVDELEAAVKLDPALAAKARKDKDFETLRWHPKFQELTKKE